jgi:deoxyribose-phosphate aldolase
MNQDFTELLELARDYEKQLPALELPAGHPGDRSMAAWIDHTLLKPEATPAQVQALCEDARQYQFAAVCGNARAGDEAVRRSAPVQLCFGMRKPCLRSLSLPPAQR